MFQRSQMLQRSKSFPTSQAAPTGGWNARDALADMDEKDAIYLTNFFPSTTSVDVRNGFSNWSTGLPGQVETLFNYQGAATSKLFAASVTSFYDCTAGGAVGVAVVTGLTNARWQYVNVSTAGGNFIYCVNGSDNPQVYNGTTWQAVTAVSAPLSLTGVTPTSIININLFKNRLWLIEKNTLNAWYLGINAVSGAATAFPLYGVARQGGYLIAMGTWTIDAGYGVDDHAVFVTSEGEIIVYKGSDPSSATTWALVGVWSLGSPIGYKCFMKYAGDLLLITQDGLLPLSGALQSSRVNPQVALSNKIFQAMSSAVSLYGLTYGWQIMYYPKNNMLITNVPVSVGNQEQYVMNTITKAWCNFTGWNANCWELFNDDPYFGANTVVCKAWDTLADNGANIEAVGKQAFNYYGSPGSYKRVTMMRPTIASNGTPTLYSSVDIDFQDVVSNSSTSFMPVSYGKWGTGLWGTALWGGGDSVNRNWQGVAGFGYAIAPKLRAVINGVTCKWIATDLVMERGAIL